MSPLQSFLSRIFSSVPDSKRFEDKEILRKAILILIYLIYVPHYQKNATKTFKKYYFAQSGSLKEKKNPLSFYFFFLPQQFSGVGISLDSAADMNCNYCPLGAF